MNLNSNFKTITGQEFFRNCRATFLMTINELDLIYSFWVNKYIKMSIFTLFCQGVDAGGIFSHKRITSKTFIAQKHVT
jgi:hypothetical protein